MYVLSQKQGNVRGTHRSRASNCEGTRLTALIVWLPFLFAVALELPQDHREMYVLKTAPSRAPARLILNARRPGFDIPDGVFRQGNRPGESDAGASLQGKANGHFTSFVSHEKFIGRCGLSPRAFWSRGSMASSII